jgi:hypothetical protein
MTQKTFSKANLKRFSQGVFSIFSTIVLIFVIHQVTSWFCIVDDEELKPSEALKYENRYISLVPKRRSDDTPLFLPQQRPSLPTEPLNITVGVMADYIFDLNPGLAGGYGTSTNVIGQFFRNYSDLGLQIVFISASQYQGNRSERFLSKGDYELFGWPLVRVRPRENDELQGLGIDVLLLTGYHNSYLSVLQALPKTPVVLWVKDLPTEEWIKNLGDIQILADAEGDTGLTRVEGNTTHIKNF